MAENVPACCAVTAHIEPQDDAFNGVPELLNVLQYLGEKGVSLGGYCSAQEDVRPARTQSVPPRREMGSEEFVTGGKGKRARSNSIGAQSADRSPIKRSNIIPDGGRGDSPTTPRNSDDATTTTQHT